MSAFIETMAAEMGVTQRELRAAYATFINDLKDEHDGTVLR